MSSKKKQAASPPPSIPAYYLYGLWAAFAWALFVIWQYSARQFSFSRILPGLAPDPWLPTLAAALRHAHALITWGIVCVGALSLGVLALKRLPIPTALGRLSASAALGLAVVAYAVLGLGFLQAYHAWTWKIFLGVLILIAVFSFRTHLSPVLSEAWAEIRALLSRASPWILLPLAALFLISFFMAFTPEIFYDAMVYHLGVPRWYLLEGGIQNAPNIHAKFPFTMQMLYLLGLGIQGEAAAKLFHWICGSLLLAVFISWAKEEGEAQGGLWAALLFLSMPMTQMNWWTTGVDLGVSLFAVLASWIWIAALRREENSPGLLILAGVFAGLAFSSKYTAGLVPAMLVAFHFAFRLWERKGLMTALRESVLIGMAAFVVALPWLLKNYIHTGNPFYPFALSIFGGDLEPRKMEIFVSQNKGLTPSNFLGVLRLPWDLTFQGLSSLSFPGALPLALLPITIWAGFARKEASRQRLALIYGLAGLLVLLFANRLLRYSMPYLGVLCALMGIACAQAASAWLRRGLAVLVFIAASHNIAEGLGLIQQVYRPWDVIMGRETPQAYLSYTHPSMNPYPATQMFAHAKQALPPGSKMLVLGDEKMSTCEVPFYSSGVFDRPLVARWAEGVSSPEKFYQKLREEKKITHILVNLVEGKRLAGYGTFDWSEETLVLFSEFWERHVRQIHQDLIPEKFFPDRGPLFLYELKPASEAGKSIPWNPALWIIEQSKGYEDSPEKQSERLAWYEALSRKYPRVHAFSARLQELKRSSQ